MSTVVGIVADRKPHDGVDQDLVRTRYLDALRKAANVVPIIIPTDLQEADVAVLMSRIDGLVLGGSESNVHPTRYKLSQEPVSFMLDTARDTTVFSAIDQALRCKMPILGICRGLQELNVAFGGTLSAEISQDDGNRIHFENINLPRDTQYLPVHSVHVVGSGPIARCVMSQGTLQAETNSLHRQGISQLGEGLQADLLADDGVIEAISVEDPSSFVAAVQWHPEWYFEEDALSQEIFGRFGRACHQFTEARRASASRLLEKTCELTTKVQSIRKSSNLQHQGGASMPPFTEIPS